MEKRKKVLLITNLLGDPDNSGVKGVGALRVSYIAKAFNDNFDLTVLTKKGQEYEKYNCVAKYDNSFVFNTDKIPFFNTFFVLFMPFESSIFWYKKLKRDILQDKEYYSNFDIVYINSPPFINSLLSKTFKEINPKIKVVIDYRDKWNYTSYLANLFNRPGCYFQRMFAEKYEKIAIDNADLVFFTTPSNTKYYSSIYGRNKIKYVPNGYDKTMLNGLKEKESDIKIVYSGDFHSKRNIYLILDVIKEIFPELKVDLYGNYSSYTKLKLRKYKNILIFHDRIPRKELYSVMFNSKILIIAQDMKSVKDWANVTYKTYDYLALGKPIIYLGDKNDNSKLVEDYAKHKLIINDYDDIASKKDIVANFIKKYLYLDVSDASKEFLDKFDSEKISNNAIDLINKLQS